MKSYAPLGALCLLACASQKSAESHSDYTGKVDTVRTEGAERVTRVEEDFVVRRQGQPEGGARHVPYIPTPGSATSGVAPAVPDTGLLRRITTTTETGPITTTTKASADAHTEAESASKSRFGPGVLGWMACAAGAVLALLLAWKFRSGLLGSALKLIGKG